MQPSHFVSPWRKGTRSALCIGCSAILLYLAMQGTDLALAIQWLRKTHPIAVISAVVFLFFSFLIRAWRWRYLLAPVKPVPVAPLFRSTMIGFMGNYLLPFRAGELMRAVSIGQTQNISKAGALGSIVLERLLDGITLSLTPFLLITVLDLPRWMIQMSGLLIGIYVLALVFFMLTALHGSTDIWLKWLTSFLPQSLAPRLQGTAECFCEGMKGLNKARALLPVFSLSLLCWLIHGMYFYCLFEALHLDLSIWVALILQAVIGVGVMLPAAPGYVGNFEYATVLGLALFGIAREEAFAYSLLAHGFQFFPVVFVGLVFVFRGGFWSQTQSERDKVVTSLS